MVRSVFGKVMWVGRATVFLVGLAVILALVFGVTTAAFAALSKPGDPFKLGVVNEINRLTALVGARTGAMLKVDNNGTGPALQLEAGARKPPLVVKANSGTATNLSADRLDGVDVPQGYAHVDINGGVDDDYPSRGINGVIRPAPETNPSLYCFDLTFIPSAGVGSPHINNGAVVAVATPNLFGLPSNNPVPSACQAPHRDAAVKTYGSDGAGAAINFQVVFF